MEQIQQEQQNHQQLVSQQQQQQQRQQVTSTMESRTMKQSYHMQQHFNTFQHGGESIHFQPSQPSVQYSSSQHTSSTTFQQPFGTVQNHTTSSTTFNDVQSSSVPPSAAPTPQYNAQPQPVPQSNAAQQFSPPFNAPPTQTVFRAAPAPPQAAPAPAPPPQAAPAPGPATRAAPAPAPPPQAAPAPAPPPQAAHAPGPAPRAAPAPAPPPQAAPAPAPVPRAAPFPASQPSAETYNVGGDPDAPAGYTMAYSAVHGEWPPKNENALNMTTTYPSGFKMRDQVPADNTQATVVTSQPAFKITQPMKRRGDDKWPPKGSVEPTQAQVREFIKPKKQDRDYSEFFAQNALPHNYAAYRPPPGTQHRLANGKEEDVGVSDM